MTLLAGLEEVAASIQAVGEDVHSLKALLEEKCEENENLRRILSLTLQGSPDAMKTLIRMHNEALKQVQQFEKDHASLFQKLQETEKENAELKTENSNLCQKLMETEHENEEIKNELETDKLTGAKSQRSFIDFQESPEKNCYAVLADLDGFKAVNDTFGHKTGDDILKLFVKTVKQVVRSSDYVFRNGGDEFFIVFRNIFNEEEAMTVYEKLAKTLRDGVSIETHKGEAKVTASISSAHHVQSKHDFDILDMEMYRDKKKNKKR